MSRIEQEVRRALYEEAGLAAPAPMRRTPHPAGRTRLSAVFLPVAASAVGVAVIVLAVAAVVGSPAERGRLATTDPATTRGATAVALPTHAAGLAAFGQLSGTLELQVAATSDTGCAYVVSQQGRRTALRFRTGWTVAVSGQELLQPDGRPAARHGDRVVVGGALSDEPPAEGPCTDANTTWLAENVRSVVSR